MPDRHTTFMTLTLSLIVIATVLVTGADIVTAGRVDRALRLGTSWDCPAAAYCGAVAGSLVYERLK